MRCFVGCWPDPGTRQQLDRLGAEALLHYPGARRVEAANLHLTLAFIGELAAPLAAQLAATLAHESVQPFDWTLDRTGRFDRARVVWAGGPASPELADLAQRARVRLQALQIRFDTKPFAAHVTLLRDVTRPAASGQVQVAPPRGIVWRIAAPHVLVSERDDAGKTRYRVLARAP